MTSLMIDSERPPTKRIYNYKLFSMSTAETNSDKSATDLMYSGWDLLDVVDVCILRTDVAVFGPIFAILVLSLIHRSTSAAPIGARCVAYIYSCSPTFCK
jgi:hypothetical protein